MFKYSDTEAKISVPKRNITVSNVIIVDGKFVDEGGNIAENILEVLPDPNIPFTIKISIKLDEEVEGDEEA